MNEIIKALEAKYHPLGIIVYGSYADGTNNLNSYFDALLLTNGSSELHDSSVMSGVELDVWIYPRAKIEAPHDAYEFLQIWDGIIISDETGLLSSLQTEVPEPEIPPEPSEVREPAQPEAPDPAPAELEPGANRTRRL